ncbi:MAG: hydrogen peroxide-inducible genes activator [Aeromonas sp.]
MNVRWPSLKQLSYLVSLAEHTHFHRAAKACHVSQSTLSAGIQTLEDLMGVTLVERDNKSVLFTPLGLDVVRRAQQLLRDARDLVELSAAQGGVMQGTLRLGCIPTIAPFLLSQLVQSTQTHYPELDLLLREDTTANLLTQLEQGQLDLLLLALPVDTHSFHVKVIGQDPFYLVLPQAQVDKLTAPFDYTDLPAQSIFLLEREHCLTEHAVGACRLQDKSKVNPFAATSLHTLVQMVSAGLGTTFLPEMAIKAGILAGTDLCAQPLPGELAYREIGLVWRQSSPRIQTFYKLAELLTPLLPASAEAAHARDAS